MACNTLSTNRQSLASNIIRRPLHPLARSNSLICDSAEEARRLALHGPHRHKVVSLDGTKFEKSGVVTGGSAPGSGQAAAFTDAELGRLKTEHDALLAQIQARSTLLCCREMRSL